MGPLINGYPDDHLITLSLQGFQAMHNTLKEITPLYVPQRQSEETDCEDHTIVSAWRDID